MIYETNFGDLWEWHWNTISVLLQKQYILQFFSNELRKLETDSAWRSELKKGMFLINFLLLSLFASSHCAPKTLLVETEGEGEADNMNPDEESETEKNESFNETNNEL